MGIDAGAVSESIKEVAIRCSVQDLTASHQELPDEARRRRLGEEASQLLSAHYAKRSRWLQRLLPDDPLWDRAMKLLKEADLDSLAPLEHQLRSSALKPPDSIGSSYSEESRQEIVNRVVDHPHLRRSQPKKINLPRQQLARNQSHTGPSTLAVPPPRPGNPEPISYPRTAKGTVIMTITPEKLEANRRNAQLSTGPTSAGGKARSAANSTKSGWFTRELRVHPSEQDRYNEFRQIWLDALQPAGLLETEVFEDFLRSSWRKHQVIEAQNLLVDSGAADALTFLDTATQSQLDRLLRYEAQFERRAQRARSELTRLQTNRALAQQQAQLDGASTAAEIESLPPLADSAKLASQKRTQIAARRAAAIDPELQRTLAILAAESQHLAARSRAFAAGLPLDEFTSPLDRFSTRS